MQAEDNITTLFPPVLRFFTPLFFLPTLARGEVMALYNTSASTFLLFVAYAAYDLLCSFCHNARTAQHTTQAHNKGCCFYVEPSCFKLTTIRRALTTRPFRRRGKNVWICKAAFYLLHPKKSFFAAFFLLKVTEGFSSSSCGNNSLLRFAWHLQLN